MLFVIFIFIVTIGIIYYFFNRKNDTFEQLILPKSEYFGSGSSKSDDTAIYPFKIDVPESELDDLKIRLENARIGHKQLEDIIDFSYGFNLKTLLEFKNYWLNEYDWRKHEALLNTFSHFKTEIWGLNIHFIHERPPENKYRKVIPLLIVHGWPGNVFEFYKIIPILTDPNKFLDGANSDVAFEVVAPSIPGYGWSDQPKKSGFNAVVASRIFHTLMVNRLGYSKFLSQGGDWGSSIVSNLAKMYPENVYGVHLNMILTITNFKPKVLFWQIFGSYFPKLVFSEPEFHDYSYKQLLFKFLKMSGYMHLQATKPDTVGVALNDSPIGILAYILEKYSGWTNATFESLHDGGIEKKFTKDELLTIIMIYWLNQNILSSQRLYKEFWIMKPEYKKVAGKFLSVPTAFAAFEHDLATTPLELAKHNYNIQQYTLFKDGGHFAAFEVPKVLAKDVLKFSRKVC